MSASKIYFNFDDAWRRTLVTEKSDKLKLNSCNLNHQYNTAIISNLNAHTCWHIWFEYQGVTMAVNMQLGLLTSSMNDFVRIRISITFAIGIVLAYALGYHIEQKVLINGGNTVYIFNRLLVVSSTSHTEYTLEMLCFATTNQYHEIQLIFLICITSFSGGYGAGRLLTSDWSVNSFINGCLWENILVVLFTENFDWT